MSSRLALARSRVSLPLVRRAVGLLSGRHRSVLTGHGQDFDDLRPYEVGDEVSDIDWLSSARAGEPVIRRFAHESSVAVVLLADTGRAMSATAPSGETKHAVIDEAAATVAYLARARGDRVALIAADAERCVHRPARGSANEIEATLRALSRQWAADAPASDIGNLIGRALKAFPRRSLMVLLTDETQPRPEHDALLKLLAVQHEVMVIGVEDMSALSDGAAAAPSLIDIATGSVLPRFLRPGGGLGGGKRLRERLALEASRAVADRRAAVDDRLLRRRVAGMRVGGSADVVHSLMALLGRSRHAR
ncbi:DUF58 domain-containing protein [Zhihengliuella halotolerans]|uniref:DUF58 domain-containing protein n=1 Tax=Zhihengliuella halotolerans TaxID=370736 RepID=UPI000C7F851C|nr:DUF58 domain-containing protein [Zhihengliuella halotolerans]